MFLVSVHETGMLRVVLEALAGLDAVFRECCGVRIGLLANWHKWRYRVEWLVAAKRRYGLLIYVDSGGFQGRVEPRGYARWLCSHWRLVDAVFAPDDPVYLCEDPLDERCRLEKVWRTVALNVGFAEEVDKRCPEALGRVSLVLQGLAPREYLECYEGIVSMLDSVGVKRSALNQLIALGSLKLRSWRSRFRALRGTLPRLLEELTGLIPGARFHLLGVHGRDLHKLLHLDNAYGADTGAQGLNYTKKHRDVLGCNGLTPACYARAVEHEVLASLGPLLKRSRVRTLDEFIAVARG